MENNSFCVFILSHGRPNKVLTKATLEKCGYSGKLFIVLDYEDTTIEEYRLNFGTESIKVFDKKKYADLIDEGNNFDNRKVVVHARNYCFDLAKELGYSYFLQLDDDYYEFQYKFTGIKGLAMPKNIDSIFEMMITFLKNSSALSIAFAQTGDFIGGIDNGKGLYRFNKRKCMNSFFCATERRFWFIGQFNEDVNAYTTLQGRGGLFLTIPVIAVNQKDSQQQKDGMTEAYLLQGTYVKAFTTVLMCPSAVKVSMMNANHKRIHHSMSWKNITPMIISEKYKKSTI